MPSFLTFCEYTYTKEATLPCPYIHALQSQHTLLYNHYNTTRPIIYATQWPCPCTHAQWACGWPGKRPFARIEYYVLRHLLAIILCLKSLEPPEEGKSIEFPRKHAILADCTTIDQRQRYQYQRLEIFVWESRGNWGSWTSWSFCSFWEPQFSSCPPNRPTFLWPLGGKIEFAVLAGKNIVTTKRRELTCPPQGWHYRNGKGTGIKDP